jgi:hypothetical protein
VTGETIQPGDLVEPHSRDLDPRVVTKVEGDSLWLDILGYESGPFPLDNYRKV